MLHTTDDKGWTDSEKKFLRRFSRGSEEAFRHVYDLYFGALCRYAYRFVLDSEVAADIVQDTFVVLWRLCDKFDSVAALRSFLYISTRNRALNHVKRIRMINLHTHKMTQETMSDEDVMTVIDVEVERVIAASLGRLPERCREVFELSVAGMSYKEIGELMDITPHTVKNQRAKAVRLLREYLESNLNVHNIKRMQL